MVMSKEKAWEVQQQNAVERESGTLLKYAEDLAELRGFRGVAAGETEYSNDVTPGEQAAREDYEHSKQAWSGSNEPKDSDWPADHAI